MAKIEKVENILLRHRIGEKNATKITTWIDSLRLRLSQLENVPAQKLNSNLLINVKCPIDEQLFEKCEASFLFQSPVAVHVVGSYALQCNSRNNDDHFEIDLLLEIPKSCWQKKDHMDFVYHYKRAFYLAYIAQHLNHCNDLILGLQFRRFNGDHLNTCIHLIPTGKLGLHYRFNIFATASYGKTFVYKTFHPTKCLIQNKALITNEEFESTPYYNQTILNDLTIVQASEYMKNLISNHSNVKDSLILMRIWLDKRNLRRHFAHIVTLLTCYLLENNLLNPNSSSIQIFETILSKLKDSDWQTNPLVINFVDDNIQEVDKECYMKNFSVNLIESSSNSNMCYNLNQGIYERIKLDCHQTIKILNSKQVDFDEIFQNSINFTSYFDFFISILGDCLKQDQLKNQKFYIQCGKNLTQTMVLDIQNLIQQAVGERLTLIQPENYLHQESWDLNAQPITSTRSIVFGILIRRENFLDQIIKGPMANQPEANNFRELWGTKRSEIRRFQNGDIRECVVWEAQTFSDRRLIVLNAIKHVMNRRMNLKLNAISWTYNYLDEMLGMRNLKFNDPQFHYGTGEECFSLINQTINMIKKHLHNLKNVSFKVNDVVNIDPAARHTDVYPPLPINSRPKNVQNQCNIFDCNAMEDKIKYIRPINLVVRLDAIGQKFSNNLEEFQNQKYLLIHELAKSLRECCQNVFVKLNSSHLDIYIQGFVFRLIIALQKELSIHRQISSNTKRPKFSGNIEADQIEFKTQVLPAICGSLNAFQNENFCYDLTCRLFKRWLSRQMIKHFFEEITIDLLVAYLFQHDSHVYPSNNSHLTMFIRVLDFIGHFDFVKNLIFLNFNNSLTIERMDSIRQSFQEQRANWPIITIVTGHDRKLSQHTRLSPDTQIVFHLQRLARIQHDQLRESLQLFKPIKLKSLFKMNMSMFDMIIKLNTKFLPNKHESFDFPDNIQIKHALYSADNEQHSMPIVDYNPAYIYLTMLKKAYHNFALFFYDQYGGREIGVLLRPEILETRPFKYSSVEATKLAGTSHSLSTDNVVINMVSLVEDFQIIGNGLVDKIIIKD